VFGPLQETLERFLMGNNLRMAITYDPNRNPSAGPRASCTLQRGTKVLSRQHGNFPEQAIERAMWDYQREVLNHPLPPLSKLILIRRDGKMNKEDSWGD
jgi:hypothetical protein